MTVLCFDEGGPYQAIPHAGRSWQPWGQPRLLPHVYVRGGTVQVLAALVQRRGLGCPWRAGHVELQTVARRPKTVVHTFLTSRVEELLAAGAPRVWVVLDNLNIHHSPELQAWLAAQQGRVRFLFTPFYASWLNLVESWLRILRDRVIAGSHYLTTIALGRGLLVFTRFWNRCPTPFRWGGLRSHRRLRALARRTSVMTH